jgi:glucokinase
MQDRLAIGVDIGATRMRVCVGRADGKLLWRSSRLMSTKGTVDDYLGQIITAVNEAIQKASHIGPLEGIGVASIGPLDLRKGEMSSPANLPFTTVPLVGPLEDETGLDVKLVNDARAGALGERNFGAGKGRENLVYLTISTGIGGGAIVDGHLLSGKDGNAGEVGHVVVDPEGRLTCGCGRRGHWEAYCSGRNIPRLAMLLLGEGISSLARKAKIPSSSEVLDAARRGNVLAKRVCAEMGRLNALGVANIVNVYDPSIITIGGGVALNNQDEIVEPLKDLVPKIAINKVPEMIVTPLGDDAGLMGALSLVFS